MSLLNNPPNAEQVALWVTGTYTVLDLILTKGEKLLDHAYRICKKYKKFKKQNDFRKLGAPSPWFLVKLMAADPRPRNSS